MPTPIPFSSFPSPPPLDTRLLTAGDASRRAQTIAEDGQRFLCEPELWNRVLALLPEVPGAYGAADGQRAGRGLALTSPRTHPCVSPGLREDLAERFATRCKTPQERWRLLTDEVEKQAQNKALDGMVRYRAL